MLTSVIRYRVADFLKGHAPFDALSELDLLSLAGSGRVKFHESEEYIFHQGDPKGETVWVIQQGRVELVEEHPSGEVTRDVLGEGDLLGLDRLIGDGSSLYSARTASDVILYGIAAAQFEALIPRYPTVKSFLSAHFSVSGVLGFGRVSWLDAELPSLDFLRARLVAVPADAPLAEIGSRLTTARNGAAALVDSAGRVCAIVSAADLCAAAFDGGSPQDWQRPLTLAAPLATREVLNRMVQASSQHAAITRDGTPEGPLEAILTASDLSLFCEANPVAVISEIRHAQSSAELIPLLRRGARTVAGALAQPADIDACCRIGTGLSAAVTEACIRMEHTSVLKSGIDPPEAPFCWMTFGEAARGELLSPSLAAIAAVYDDGSDLHNPADSAYFVAVAGETLGRLHSCGLDGPGLNWPDGSRPCMALSEWKRLYAETIRDPLGSHLYARREFFDVRRLSGDPSILYSLQDVIRRELRECDMAIPLLANDTLAHLPPLTFFQGLVLDWEGKQHESFDISEAAIAPIADAARVFAIARGRLEPADTIDRLAVAATEFPEGAAIFREAAGAFRIALYYRSLAGGSRITVGDLGRFDQRILKTAFASLQRLLEFTASTFIPSA